MKKIIIAAIFSTCILGAVKPALAVGELMQRDGLVTAAPVGQTIEAAFSPGASGEALVVKVIRTSQRKIRLAAYSFTSPTIVQALMDAHRRGVDIRVLVDEDGNKGKANIAALNLLVNAGIPARTISSYKIHHDKYIISDDRHVQNGSFNYSKAAAKSNSENVLVVWNNQRIAEAYTEHWTIRWNKGANFRSTY
jgi:phosphatidylserine/phosphatidylglycerophosphate/cardiolipin synthase-like enzyme